MTERDAVRRGYDDLGDAYAAERSDHGPEITVLDRFLDSLPDSALVLDAGCGPGAPVLRRTSAAATAIGLDFSREQLRLATGNAPRATLVQGDMTALPFADGAFDAVTAYHALIHVPLDEHRTVLDEFARVLRPGGRVLLSEGPDEWSGSTSDWLGSDVGMQWSIAGADATRERLRDAGFTVTSEWDLRKPTEDGEEWVFFAARLGT